MEEVLVSLPEQLATRMKAVLPREERSRTIAELIAREIDQREQQLARCARELEKDQHLQQDMKAWAATLNDGLSDEAW